MSQPDRRYLAIAAATSTLMLAGCAPGQTFGPPCPQVDYDVVLEVTIDSEKTVEGVGICDEIACTTDPDIPAGSDVAGVQVYEPLDENTWRFSLIVWMPKVAGFVAIVDGEEVDLGNQQLTISFEPIHGQHCGEIPSYEPITLQL